MVVQGRVIPMQERERLGQAQTLVLLPLLAVLGEWVALGTETRVHSKTMVVTVVLPARQEPGTYPVVLGEEAHGLRETPMAIEPIQALAPMELDFKSPALRVFMEQVEVEQVQV
jgi:hypothetical protein